MSKTRTEKITGIEEQIQQLENKRKLLIQQEKTQERKDRTKRLCRRMGLFESMLPESITLSEELFKTFLEKTIATDQSRRLLDKLTAQNAQNNAQQGAETAARVILTPADEMPETATQGGEDEDTDEGDGAGVLELS